MLDDLRPLSLSDAARDLGVDPFEVVRLMVASEIAFDSLTLTRDDVAQVRRNAAIERWWADSTLPVDENRLRAAVRGALHQLLSRGLIGEATTRLDNLWRGLELEQQMAIEQAVMVLLEEEKLLTAASPRGVQVSVSPPAADALEKIANGEVPHDGINAVCAG